MLDSFCYEGVAVLNCWIPGQWTDECSLGTECEIKAIREGGCARHSTPICGKNVETKLRNRTAPWLRLPTCIGETAQPTTDEHLLTPESKNCDSRLALTTLRKTSNPAESYR
jgi:hypothetical protein